MSLNACAKLRQSYTERKQTNDEQVDLNKLYLPVLKGGSNIRLGAVTVLFVYYGFMSACPECHKMFFFMLNCRVNDTFDVLSK